MPVLGAPLGGGARGAASSRSTTGAARGNEPVRALLRPRRSRCGPAPRPLPLAELARRPALPARVLARGSATELNYRRFFDVTTLAAVRVEDAGRLRRDPPPARSSCVRAGDDRRPAHRPPGRAGRPARLPRPAGRRDRRRLGRRREDPRGRRAAAERLALRRHDRLRRAAARRRALRRPGRRAAADDLSTELLGEHQDLEAMVTDAKRWSSRRCRLAEVNRLMRLVGRVLARRWTRPPCARARGAARRHGPLPRLPRPGRGGRTAQQLADARARRGLGAPSGLPTRGPRRPGAVVELARWASPPGARASTPRRPARVRRAVPADLRPGHGQGHRGHRLLPLRAAHRRSTRSAATPAGSASRPTSSTRFAASASWRRWPTTMTTLSTHDTKRAEDVRARLCGALRACRPSGRRGCATARELAAPAPRRRLDALTEYLLWQTLGRRLADQRPSGCRATPQGDPRGQGAHAVDRAGRGLRGGRRAVRRPAPDRRPEIVAHVDAWVDADRAGGARRHARPEAAPAVAARRPRRLPGHRARRPVARRPRQPPPRRLRGAPRPAGPARRGRAARATWTTRSCSSPSRALRAAPRPARVVRRDGRRPTPPSRHLERARRGLRSRRRTAGSQVVTVVDPARRAAARDAGAGATPTASPARGRCGATSAQRRGRRSSDARRPGRARASCCVTCPVALLVRR